MTGRLLDFFTLEADEYVEQLDALVSRATSAPPDAEAFARSVRALRGSATMAKVMGIAKLAQGLERIAREVKDGQLAWDAASRGVTISAIDDAKILIRAVRAWGDAEDARVAARVAEIERIAGAPADDVVPIAAFLAEGADAIQAAANPPTTAAHRFRLEVVSQAEHLRRAVHDGRHATDAATRDRRGRELRTVVRGLARTAQSFGAIDIAHLFLAAERGAAGLEQPALDVLERGAMLLCAPDTAPEALAPQFVLLSERLRRGVTPVLAPPAQPVTATRSAGPSGAALRSLLAQGLAGLAQLDSSTFATPVVGEEDDVIPIEDLLFRGKDALTRAIQLGDVMRASAGAPASASLAELYDLLQLAAAE